MRKAMMAALVLASAVAGAAAWGQTPASPSTQPGVHPIVPAAVESKPTVDLPVKRVMLFTSGTGFFEHEGTVDGSATGQLSFTTSQINDVLKSMVAQDMDGGTIGGVRYASQKPLSKALQSFQVDISGNPGLSALLTQIRGAEVTAETTAGNFNGKVVGVEHREVDGAAKGQTKLVLNLLHDQGVRSVDLNTVTNIRIEDEKLRKEMGKALEVVAQRRDRDKKQVAVSFDGTGKRRVRLGYVVESPVWKTSYRLMLPKEGAKDATLQGWAIVENGTESDWVDVSLSLVGGRPLSFIENLYASYYVPRPVVQPRSFAGLTPAEHEDGIDVRKLEKDFEKFSNPESAAGGGGGGSSGSLFSDTSATRPAPATEEEPLAKEGNDEFQQTVASGGINGIPVVAVTPPNYLQGVSALARLQKIGVRDSFEFKVDKVNLARQQSTMLPILTEPVTVERVSVYNEAVLTGNALNGIVLTNSSKSYVRGGPVTVMETGKVGAAYVGDSLVADLPPGQHRLLSYGVDQDLKVLKEVTDKDIRVKTRIHAGVFTSEVRKTRITVYTLENRGDKDKTVLLEQLQESSEWKVTSPPVEEKTEIFNRFRGTVAAGKTALLKVVEEMPENTEFPLRPRETKGDNWSAIEIEEDMSDAVKKALKEYNAAVEDLQHTEARVVELLGQRKEVATDEERMRENLKATDKTSEYYAKLLKKLQESDDKIEAIDTDIAKNRKAKEALMKKAEAIEAR